MKIIKPSVLSIMMTQLILISASIAPADIVTNPLGLNPGDQFRLVFVTSQTRNAVSTNIQDYNQFVTDVANNQPLLSALTTSWSAMVSTETITARDNTGTNPFVMGDDDVPFYRLDGLKVADSNFDLWDGTNPDNFININEFGGPTPITLQSVFNQMYPWVWTGSSDGGVRSPYSYLGVTTGPSAGFPVAGLAPDIPIYNNEWFGIATSSINDSHAFYAVSSVLTVNSVPEPSSVLPALACLVAIVICLRRRRALLS